MDNQRGEEPTLSPPPKTSQAPEGKWISFDEAEAVTRSNNNNPVVKGVASYPPTSNHDSPAGGAQVNSTPSIAQIDVTVENVGTSAAANGVEAARPPQTDILTKQQNGASKKETTTIDMGPGPAPPSASNGTSPPENGKKISTILPQNQLCPWIVPAKFDAYKMPKSLVAEYITMPVEEYVTTMEMLTNDFRFRLYTMMYRRLIATWLVFSFFILCILLASGTARGVVLFALLLVWMALVAFGVFGCLILKKMIHRGLHHCVRAVNGPLLKHKLLVGVEDRGKLSCHKIAVHFIRFDTTECQARIANLLSQTPSKESTSATAAAQSQSHDGADTDPNYTMAARGLIVKYSQSYVKSLMRRRIRFPSRPSEGVSEFAPAHCSHSYCLCQYVQKVHFDRKESKGCLERFFLVGDLNIADLEAPVYASSSYPVPAMAFHW